MGDPKHARKKFESPRKLWDRSRIDEEKKLAETYGLKNKREIWRAETILRKKRQNARNLLAKPLEERLKRERELLDSLIRLGVLNENAVLDDVLTLTTNELLERRLQTMVWRKGLANTATQARQFITHGHVSVGGKKVTAPSYLVSRRLEGTVGYYGKPMVLEAPKTAETKVEKKEKPSRKKDFEEVKQAAEKLEAGEKAEGKAEKKEEKAEKPKEEKKEAKPAKEAKPNEEKKEVKAEKKEVKEAKPEKPKEEKKAEKKEENKPAEAKEEVKA